MLPPYSNTHDKAKSTQKQRKVRWNQKHIVDFPSRSLANLVLITVSKRGLFPTKLPRSRKQPAES